MQVLLLIGKCSEMKYNIMPSQLQERLADNIVKNSLNKHPVSKRKLVMMSGYLQSNADGKATEIVASKGVKEVLKRKYDIDETQVRSRLGEILARPLKVVETDHILRAVENTARILGMNAPDKHIVLSGDLTTLLREIKKEKQEAVNDIESKEVKSE